MLLGLLQVSSNSVRVIVSYVSLCECHILNDDNVKMLYVEYHFLGIPLEETETPCALAKPHTAGKQIMFNFSKSESLLIIFLTVDWLLLHLIVYTIL